MPRGTPTASRQQRIDWLRGRPELWGDNCNARYVFFEMQRRHLYSRKTYVEDAIRGVEEMILEVKGAPSGSQPAHHHRWVYYELSEAFAAKNGSKYLAICIGDSLDDRVPGCTDQRLEHVLPDGYRPARVGEGGFVLDREDRL